MKNRNELITPTDQANLTIQFKDQSGNPIDCDSYPQISIYQPSGLISLAFTSAGVTRTGIGTYSYIFDCPINGPLGVWHDVWRGYINGFLIQQEFPFIINTSDIPQVSHDGYLSLGDDPGFDYSQAAIKNINKLLKSLKARLNSSGKSKSADASGNVIYLDCDIFSIDMLTTFLSTALWQFNQVPFFTSFTYDDDAFVNQFGEMLVEGATLYALASKALLERGREFTLSDNGINFTPPGVSDIMNTQYSSLLTAYIDMLKYIKNSLRPGPLGLGLFSMTGGLNPAIRRLRHLRQRQIV